MDKKQNDPVPAEEIRKEFQVERMILFSDAVFAIVITLMAIEIKLPDLEGNFDERLSSGLMHLFPELIAYIASFFFIGAIWFQHLKIFSLVRDYDKGLVIRNLILLFFIGLFPFTASIIAHAHGNILAFFIYMLMIEFCMLAQLLLQHYILIKKPELRVSTVDKQFYTKLDKNKSAVLTLFILTVSILITNHLIEDPQLKTLSVLLMAFFPLVFKVLHRVLRSETKAV
ncbi:MAG TPA: TMEM175 family protein [Bacteroidia bacterium]|nr:TMEM175 family protein [Bacteroidia bacterium]